ncbi:MAG: dynamin family protein, partial [Peptococcaceae bacterium]|nr:dynamin family protein [Peptococcaceae bacterium]
MAMQDARSQQIISALDTLSTDFRQCGDEANAQILTKLRTKYAKQEFIIACCGYVSSGKSLLINKLCCDATLLPVSPIPTSMNSVYIRPGFAATMNLRAKNGELTSITRPTTESFHAMCCDANLAEMEIAVAQLAGFSLVDTAGVDSAAKAEQLLQDFALVLSDVVIYIVDYNSVQAHINFSVLQEMQIRQIPYILVINQVDKHVEFELTLAEFRQSIVRSLQQWKLEPLALFFISLENPNHPDSEFARLEGALEEVSRASTYYLPVTIKRAVNYLLHCHSEFMLAQTASARGKVAWVLAQPIKEQEARTALVAVEQDINSLTDLADTLATEIRGQITSLLQNAPLISYATRELAEHFLASRQPGFKVGFFAGKVKTELERETRFKKLYTALSQSVEANLMWHLRQILTCIPTQYNLSLEDFEADFAMQAMQLVVEFKPDLLLEALRPGAVMSAEYVMNYTTDIAVKLKALYRQTSVTWLERACAAANRKMERLMPQMQARLRHYQAILASLATLNSLDKQHSEYMQNLKQTWEKTLAYLSVPEPGKQFHNLTQKANPKAQVLSLPNAGTRNENIRKVKKSELPTPGIGQLQHEPVLRALHPKLRFASQKLLQCARLLEPAHDFTSHINALQQRAARLENSLFTVALFGAFSAGKSSLANALLGDIVLPVSPNPTTAAINKILPPNPQYRHGTIKVKLKSELDLATDVLSAAAACGLEASNYRQALLAVQAMAAQEVPMAVKAQYDFVCAVRQGNAELAERLGEELTLELADLRSFVVEEDKACLVEWIELYYSCPLTESGIVLVDTPGSNSNNSRHTNVAFDFIKNADAVLFVTYYNNAFCKADAQFLAQLGKVKDSFATDKMFFIINAADLAESEGELTEVVKHVTQSLRTFDIVKPRVFPVSSHLAVLAKLAAVD